MVTEHMAGLGLAGTRPTQPGGDDGVDLVAEGAAVQIIIGRETAGKPLVERLRRAAARRGAGAIAYSGVGFSPRARRYAADNGIALFMIHENGRVAPDNELAKRLAESGPRVLPRLEPEPARRGRPLSVLALPFASGRWYFYVCVLSWGLLSCVPFIHGFARLRDRWARRMAVLFGSLPLPYLVVLVEVSKRVKDGPVRDWVLVALTFAPLLAGIVACFLLHRLRREVYQLDPAPPGR